MKKIISRQIALGLLLTMAKVCAAAVLQNDSSMICPVEIDSSCYKIQGEITQDDAVRIRQIGSMLRSSSPLRKSLFHLDSEGGDVASAIAIGRELRQIAAVVVVDSKCLSACVFLIAGGVKRIIPSDTKVGIHRPYSPRTDEREYGEVQRERDLVRAQILSFMGDMNLPSSLTTVRLNSRCRGADQALVLAAGRFWLVPT